MKSAQDITAQQIAYSPNINKNYASPAAINIPMNINKTYANTVNNQVPKDIKINKNMASVVQSPYSNVEGNQTLEGANIGVTV